MRTAALVRRSTRCTTGAMTEGAACVPAQGLRSHIIGDERAGSSREWSAVPEIYLPQGRCSPEGDLAVAHIVAQITSIAENSTQDHQNYFEKRLQGVLRSRGLASYQQPLVRMSSGANMNGK